MLERAVQTIAYYRHLPQLPWRVASFYLRARRRARQLGDEAAVVAAASPRQVALILRLARGHDEIVEIGTGSAWTCIALALANPRARVTTYDPFPRELIPRYLELVPEAAQRITFVHGPGEQPRGDTAPSFLFIDGDHEHDTTIAAYAAWRNRLPEHGVVVFHDYDPGWPGVISAIDELGLLGTPTLSMFVTPPSALAAAR